MHHDEHAGAGAPDDAAHRSAGSEPEAVDRDRRAFLKMANTAGVVLPPVMALLLSTTMSSPAIAASAACNRGRGNGPEGCDPGNSSGQGRTLRAGEANGG